MFTPFTNLKKTAGMDDGQVGYHNQKLEFFINNVAKDRMMLKKIEKTRKEEYPNFKEVYDNRLKFEKMQR